MLNGPSYIPKNSKNALILFHGYGADGDDLFSLSIELRNIFKNMAFFTPNGVNTTIGGGYEWFSLDDYFTKPNLNIDYLKELETRSCKIIPTIDAYIEQIVSQTGIQKENIFIGGFSQGGLIASQIAFSSKDAFSGLILMSPVPMVTIPSTAKKIPVLLTRGLQDTVIPPQAALLTKPTLEDAGFLVNEDIDPFMAHGISTQHFNSLITFIRQNIK